MSIPLMYSWHHNALHLCRQGGLVIKRKLMFGTMSILVMNGRDQWWHHLCTVCVVFLKIAGQVTVLRQKENAALLPQHIMLPLSDCWA